MEAPKIHDIYPPGEFLPEPDPSTPWWLWALVVLGSLLIIGSIFFFLRKPSSTKQLATYLDEARSKLAKLTKEAETLEPHIIATRISLIVRRYLEAAFKDTALFETNEEFTLRPHALEKLHPDSRELVKDYLKKLSNLKYTPSGIDDTSQLIHEAEGLFANIELHVTTSAA